jgi:hypothetical protein
MVEKMCYKPQGHGFNSQYIIGYLNWPNPSSRIIHLGFTQPLTEKSYGIKRAAGAYA